MKLSEFFTNLKRILRLVRKPSWNELWISIKISALGIIIIGLVGYVIMIIATAITGSITGG
ncbi:MAG: protein translocase SEC61 complex subunit gamma [Candidatus Asgardarchaeia archaeon]|nr:protein translocase SEC61 complex subunit gamma [Candidatus Odinarchaeota archaeon]